MITINIGGGTGVGVGWGQGAPGQGENWLKEDNVFFLFRFIIFTAVTSVVHLYSCSFFFYDFYFIEFILACFLFPWKVLCANSSGTGFNTSP